MEKSGSGIKEAGPVRWAVFVGRKRRVRTAGSLVECWVTSILESSGRDAPNLALYGSQPMSSREHEDMRSISHDRVIDMSLQL